MGGREDMDGDDIENIDGDGPEKLTSSSTPSVNDDCPDKRESFSHS